MSRWSAQRHGAQHLPGTILPGVPLAQFVPSQPSRVDADAAASAVEAELVQSAEALREAFDDIVQHPGGAPAPIVEAEIVPAALTTGIAPAATEAERFAAESSGGLAGPWSAPGSPAWPTSIPAWGRAPQGYGRALAQVPRVAAPHRSAATSPSPRDLVGHGAAS